MSENESELCKKIDIMNRLLALNLVKDKSVVEQIDILTKAGLKVTDIASILDKTENHVYVTQTSLRKKKKQTIETPNNQSNKIDEKSIEIQKGD